MWFSFMKRLFFLAYGFCGYLIGLASVAYMTGFLADFAVPKSISDGETTALWQAALTDAGLVALFGFHHSLFARSWFKRWWTRFIPTPIERATYLYTTAIMTVVLVTFWQPLPVTLLRFEATWSIALMIALYLAAWSMMLSATFHFGHFGFFGLAQAWAAFRKSPPAANTHLTTRWLYALVRHPISLGWMITPWLTPHLTLGHVVFALSALLYILVATPFEEADLIEEMGDDYRAYRKRVPAFLPVPKARPKPDCLQAAASLQRAGRP